MSTSMDELERLLRLLLADQCRLAELLVAQRHAMRGMQSSAMEKIASDIGVIRQRVAASEPRRKALTLGAAREVGIIAPDPALSQIAAALKDATRQARLLALREELRVAVNSVAAASHVAGRLAGAVLGHLNTAIRTVSGAMSGTPGGGAYTRTGSARMTSRLGAIEAVA